ncbi:MAG: hypothetical protein KatS3mg106_368 [Gemmataceae bacterium]|nr:MAG: hypothetical protein KatS3mg106_368 [Gemmataceae bacterium]
MTSPASASSSSPGHCFSLDPKVFYPSLRFFEPNRFAGTFFLFLLSLSIPTKKNEEAKAGMTEKQTPGFRRAVGRTHEKSLRNRVRLMTGA